MPARYQPGVFSTRLGLLFKENPVTIQSEGVGNSPDFHNDFFIYTKIEGFSSLSAGYTPKFLCM